MPLHPGAAVSRRAVGRTLRRRPARGLSLVELLVAVALGLVITGIVLVVYLGGVLGHRQVAALARMTLDAQMALGTLARDIRMAGHVESTGVVAPAGGMPAGLARPVTVARPVFGCDAGFADDRAALGTTACGTGGLPALEVTFEVTLDTAPTSASDDGAVPPAPTDCLGHPVEPLSGGAGAGVRLASHRYYLDTPAAAGSRRSLYCASTARAMAAPLVEGVEALRLRYGVAPGWMAGQQDTRRPQRYVTAANVRDWSEVVAVRICVVMRSAEPVYLRGQSVPYVDCDGAMQSPADLHLYRAFHATATIRNRARWG